jgi:hypothetical protein
MYTFPTLERLPIMMDGVPQTENVVRIELGN